MKTSSIIWTVVIVLVIAIGGYLWWSYSMPPSSQPYASTTTSTSTALTPTSTPSSTTPTSSVSPAHPITPIASLVLNTSNSASLGTYLVAGNGMTLYVYNKDSAGVSNCTGACATAWPPYTVSAAQAAALSAGANITGDLGTITRADGSLQLTYNGLPLYFFTQDATAGSATGQNVNGFTVVKP